MTTYTSPMLSFAQDHTLRGEPDRREPEYKVEILRQELTVEPLLEHKAPYNGWFAYNDREGWISFAVLAWSSTSLENDAKTVLGKCVFWGEGPSGNLRECRHTYWGDDGYLFYPNGELIIAAFQRLANFFDEMVSEVSV